MHGRTLLSWALENGSEIIVRLLLERLTKDNLDPESKDHNGRTALSWAAGRGKSNKIQLLLDSGAADINSKDNEGRAPLSWAAEDRYYESAVTVLL